jgi:hypothetical protein
VGRCRNASNNKMFYSLQLNMSNTRQISTTETSTKERPLSQPRDYSRGLSRRIPKDQVMSLEYEGYVLLSVNTWQSATCRDKSEVHARRDFQYECCLFGKTRTARTIHDGRRRSVLTLLQINAGVSDTSQTFTTVLVMTV